MKKELKKGSIPEHTPLKPKVKESLLIERLKYNWLKKKIKKIISGHNFHCKCKACRHVREILLKTLNKYKTVNDLNRLLKSMHSGI